METFPNHPGWMRKITIVDVAQAAGVGIGTASRALNGKRGVAPKTREDVHRAAVRLGYTPDPLFRRLVARRQGGGSGETLGYLYRSGETVDGAQLADVRAAAARHGYGVDARTVTPGNLSTHLRELHARGIEGLMIRADQGAFPTLPENWRRRFRLLLLGDHPGIDAPAVQFDFAKGIDLAVSKLFLAGHRRIACWLVDDGQSVAHLRARGMVLALRERQDSRRDHLELSLNSSPPGRIDLAPIAKWMETVCPDALIGPSNEHLHQLRRWVTPPCLSDAALVSLFGPPEPGIVSLGFGMSDSHRICVPLLLESIRLQEPLTLTHLIPPRWMEEADGIGAVIP